MSLQAGTPAGGRGLRAIPEAELFVEGENTLYTGLEPGRFEILVPGKGTKRSMCSVNAVMEWIKSLGWKKVTIQIDQESALSKVFEQVQQRMGVAIRKSPRCSSQSLADGEMVNGLIAGKVRLGHGLQA